MKKQLFSLLIIIICLLILYYHFKSNTSLHNVSQDTIKASTPITADSIIAGVNNEKIAVHDSMPGTISAGNIPPDTLVNFAQTLIGTPYLYASTDPQKGFDCS